MSSNYLIISHEITKISVLAGNSYEIVPLYMSMRLSSQGKGCLFWDFQVHYYGKARVRLCEYVSEFCV